jgi:hypothetical protein
MVTLFPPAGGPDFGVMAEIVTAFELDAPLGGAASEPGRTSVKRPSASFFSFSVAWR